MKYKLLRLSLLSLLAMLFVGGAYALVNEDSEPQPEVTLDFTSTDWGFPTTKAVDEQSFTSNGYTIKVAGTTGNGYRYYTGNDAYFLNGKQGAYIIFPAFDFDVEKIVIVGHKGASAAVVQNIFVEQNGEDVAVSTETTGAGNNTEAFTNTYEIAEGYQAAGTVYKLKVTSNHNTQLTKVYVYKKAASEESAGFRDFAVQLTDANIFDTSINNFGVKVAEDGTYTATTADDATANFTVNAARFNDAQHGWVNCTFTVPVEGAVKIELGDCQFGGQNGTITDGNGNVTDIKANATKKCWSANAPHENVVVAYYAGTEPTTLTIKYDGYCPFIAVTKINPADIPSEATVTFAVGDSGAEGVAPAAKKVEIGSTVKVPANTTLYTEGKTLTAWTDGTNQYKAGDEITVTEDITLTPVFTANTVAFTDRTAETTLTWQFGEANGVGTLNAQGSSTILITQATIGNETIDVKMDIDATNGKINNVGRGDKWAQCNDGTKLIIPSYKGTAVSFDSYGDGAGTTIGGVDATDKAATYNGTAATLDIVAKGMGYIASVTAVYPAPSAEGDWAFRDFGIDLVNILTDEQRVEKQAVEIGVAVAEDGTLTQVAYGAANANISLKGTYWNDHGWTGTEATVKVEGPVQIDLGYCNYGSGDITVLNAEGETVATGKNINGQGCWSANAPTEKLATVKYTGEATTLTIKYDSYLPYIGVKAIEATSVEIAYELGNVECEGELLLTGGTYAAGDEYTIPAKNFTLYKEGYTLTAWTDGTNEYAAGSTITLSENLTLTPVFTQNEVSLADRTEPVTLKFDFQRNNGAPSVQWEGKNNLVWVTQAEVNGKTIDVATHFSTAPGKFANKNWGDWCQLNNGTTFTIPSAKGAVVSIESYSATTTTTIDGQTDYVASGNVVTYDVMNTAETIDIVIGDGSYFRYIQTVLPVAEKPFQPQTFDNAAANIVWALNSVDDYATPNTLEPEDGYSLVTVSVGDFTTTVDAPSAGANNGIKMLKLQPTGGDNTNVEFIVKPYRGLTFTPAKVSAKVARFGTDGGTLNVSAKNAEGKEVSLATGLIPARNNKDQADDAKGGDPNYTTEFSFDIPAELATAESFSLIVTENGLATNKQWGIGDVHITGTINGQTEDVAKYTIAVAANPEEGGSVNCYPQGDTFDEGTELKLTATEKFGYDFVNWTNAEGEVLAEEPVFVYTLMSDAVLTANFKKVNTYELALTVDGTNDYMVTINPAPTVVDGKNMYEEGTAVQLNANQYEGLVTFTNWSDGETNSSKTISMSDNISLTAFYAEADIIAGWDFYRAGSSGRKADFAAEDNDADVLNLVNTETGEVQGWLDKSTVGGGGYESFAGAAVNWRTGQKNGDVGNWHWQTKVNAAAFTDINVQFQMLYNYNAYQTYDAEYSLDGENWTKFGNITMTGAKAAASFSEKLPAAANNQADLFIRMKADKTSNVDGTASANDGNTLAMFFITGTPKLIDDGVAPVLASSVPANNATGASATGKIVLTFDERVKVKEDAKATLGNQELTPAVSGKTVTFQYKGLEYATEYTFTLPANSVADLTDNYLAEAITINFTTMVRPSVTKKAYDFIVPDDGTFKEALLAAAARADQSQRYRIFVKKGNYVIPANQTTKVDGNDSKQYADPKTSFGSPNVSIIGEDRELTTVTNEMPNSLTDNPDAGKGGQANPLEGIRTSGVLYLTSGAQNTYFQDIKLWSATADGTGRNVVLVDGGNHTVCKNVNLWAYQDTYVSDNTRSHYYFEGGILRGRTDFLCGSGDVFYNNVTLQMCEEGGYIAVPRDNVKYGYVFKDCTIKGETSKVDGNYYLGRPWTKGAEVYYIDTKMEAVPKGEGWANMSSDGCTRMAEYNSMTANGSVIDLSARTKVLGGNPNDPILTAEEALEIGDLHNMFGDWDPTLLTEQAPLPTNVKISGNTLTWDDSNYALLWAIVKNGSVVDFTTEPTYAIDDTSAEYAVRAANEMGGLSEAVAASITVGITNVDNQTNTAEENVYTLQGVRVQKAQKGLYIIGGRKVVVK